MVSCYKPAMLVAGKLQPRHNRCKSLQRCVYPHREAVPHLRRTAGGSLAAGMMLQDKVTKAALPYAPVQPRKML